MDCGRGFSPPHFLFYSGTLSHRTSDEYAEGEHIFAITAVKKNVRDRCFLVPCRKIRVLEALSEALWDDLFTDLR